MQIGSPIPRKKARIEIIPLIDVMFFLLASFMMVSLSMQRLRTLRMDLPSAVAATPSKSKPRVLEVLVDRNGDVKIDDKRVTLVGLREVVIERTRDDAGYPVYIKAANEATHGMVINVLDTIKAAGARKVSFQLDVDAPKK